MARSRRAGPFPFQRRLLSRGGGKHQGTPRLVLWREAAGLGLSPSRADCPAKGGARLAAPFSQGSGKRHGLAEPPGALLSFFSGRRKAFGNAALRTMARSRRAGPFPFQSRLPGQGRRFAAPFSEAAESGTAWRNRRATCGPFPQSGGKHLGTPHPELWREPPSRVFSLSGRLPVQGRRVPCGPFFLRAARSVWKRRVPAYGASRRDGPFPFQRRLPSRGGGKHLGTPRPGLWREPPGWAFPLPKPPARPKAAPCGPFFRGGGKHLGTPRSELWREAAVQGLFPFGPPAVEGWRKAFGNAAPRPMARSRRAGPFPFRAACPAKGGARLAAPFSQGGGKHLGTPRPGLWREPPGWAFPLPKPPARPKVAPRGPFSPRRRKYLGTPRPAK